MKRILIAFCTILSALLIFVGCGKITITINETTEPTTIIETVDETFTEEEIDTETAVEKGAEVETVN